MKRIVFFTVVATVMLSALPILKFGVFRPSVVVAHTPGGMPTVHPPSPPTYDYDTVTPGTQPPTSPLLAGAEARQLSTLELLFHVFVPLEELQAILPDGYTALETAPGSGRARIFLVFTLQGRIERVGVGTFGPSSGLLVIVNVRNTALKRLESFYLAIEHSDASAIGAFNAVFGPGSSRLADVEVEVNERRGRLRMKFEVKDEDIGLKVKVRARGPAALDGRLGHGDPWPTGGATPGPIHGLNEGMSAHPGHWTAFMFDGRAVPTTTANFRLEVGDDNDDGKLRLPGGSVTIVGVSPDFQFMRWTETFVKAE